MWSSLRVAAFALFIIVPASGAHADLPPKAKSRKDIGGQSPDKPLNPFLAFHEARRREAALVPLERLGDSLFFVTLDGYALDSFLFSLKGIGVGVSKVEDKDYISLSYLGATLILFTGNEGREVSGILKRENPEQALLVFLQARRLNHGRAERRAKRALAEWKIESLAKQIRGSAKTKANETLPKRQAELAKGIIDLLLQDGSNIPYTGETWAWLLDAAKDATSDALFTKGREIEEKYRDRNEEPLIPLARFLTTIGRSAHKTPKLSHFGSAC